MIHRVRTIIKKLIPYPFHYYLEKNGRKSFSRSARKDVRHFAIKDNAYFEVYWKIYGIGRGPALVLYIEGEEVLKFDFFGEGKGHYHAQMILPSLCTHHFLYLPEKTVEDQIGRAFFELEKNLYWYLERHPLKNVRTFRVKKTHLRQLLNEIRPILVEYQTRVPCETINLENGFLDEGKIDSLSIAP